MTEPPSDRDLPRAFLDDLARLAASYLASPDLLRQSGFGGGPTRWRAEREPILIAIERGGSLLDVGCANGFLLECLCAWGAERGLALVPFGLDQSTALVELARQRLPAFRAHFHVGNAWSWSPPRRFDYVYSLADVVPAAYLAAYLRRVVSGFLAPRGRLVVGSYGSVSRRLPPLDLARVLPELGFRVVGAASAGPGEVVRFAWVEGGLA